MSSSGTPFASGLHVSAEISCSTIMPQKNPKIAAEENAFTIQGKTQFKRTANSHKVGPESLATRFRMEGLSQTEPR